MTSPVSGVASRLWLPRMPVFIAGFVNLAYSSMAQTLVQLSAPSASRGRIIGLFHMSSLGLMTFSGLSVGVGGSFIGIHWSLGLSACVLAAVALSLRYFHRNLPP